MLKLPGCPAVCCGKLGSARLQVTSAGAQWWPQLAQCLTVDARRAPAHRSHMCLLHMTTILLWTQRDPLYLPLPPVVLLPQVACPRERRPPAGRRQQPSVGVPLHCRPDWAHAGGPGGAPGHHPARGAGCKRGPAVRCGPGAVPGPAGGEMVGECCRERVKREWPALNCTAVSNEVEGSS
jgi:hypothetical protein